MTYEPGPFTTGYSYLKEYPRTRKGYLARHLERDHDYWTGRYDLTTERALRHVHYRRHSGRDAEFVDHAHDTISETAKTPKREV